MFIGMSKEVEHLILENTELLATKYVYLLSFTLPFIISSTVYGILL